MALGENRWLSFGARVLTMGCALGLALGLLLAGRELAEYSQSLELVLVPLLKSNINEALPFALAAVALSVAAYHLGKRVRSEKTRALLATGVPWLPAALVVGYVANTRYLPGFFELRSLAGNLGLGLLLLFLWYGAARGLMRWVPTLLVGGRRPFVSLALVLLMVAAINAAAATVAKRASIPLASKPNVIILLVDVLRGDRLGVYGYSRDTSPNIDAFAQDAVLFEQAVAQSTFTKSSVSSLFTGLYPHHHGVYIGTNFEDPASSVRADTLSPELSTLTEVLQPRGYLTVAWVQNAQLRAYMGFDQGFTRYHDQPGKIDAISSGFSDFQDRLGMHAPFYAYLHFLDLHGPYLPQPPWDTKFGRYSDRFDYIDMSNWRFYRAGVRDGTIRPTDQELQQLSALYDGQIAYVDSRIGSILDRLKENGLYDDALIIFTADHGDGFMEHGFISHSNLPYEELLRVPLIIKFPKSEHAGRRIGHEVALVDVSTTIMDFVNAPDVPETDGRSLLDYLADGQEEVAGAGRHIVSEHRDDVSIRSDEWKLIYSPDGRRELYDLLRDPGETENLIGARPEIVAQLEPLARQVVAIKNGREATEQVVVDDATADQLRALGYMDP